MDLRPIRKEIHKALNREPSLCALLIRFAWHCSGTYDKEKQNGGCNGGTMRFDTERNDPENAGFKKAFELFDRIKKDVPGAHDVSFADLYVLGGYVAIHWSGGPLIPFRTGRLDYSKEEACARYGASGCPFGDGANNPHGSRLPAADLGVDEDEKDNPDAEVREKKTIDGIRGTFQRMGFSDKETVALIILGHQYGRGNIEVSGYDGFWYPFGPYDWNISLNPRFGYLAVYGALDKFKETTTSKGNRQYELKRFGPKFMMMPVDMALHWDKKFRVHLQYYMKNRAKFRADAVRAWKKLTELGCKESLKDEMEYS